MTLRTGLLILLVLVSNYMTGCASMENVSLYSGPGASTIVAKAGLLGSMANTSAGFGFTISSIDGERVGGSVTDNVTASVEPGRRHIRVRWLHVESGPGSLGFWMTVEPSSRYELELVAAKVVQGYQPRLYVRKKGGGEVDADVCAADGPSDCEDALMK